MTKFILHGGATSLPIEENKLFFREILKGLKSPIKLLIIYFSREEEEWPKLLKQDKPKFMTAAGKRKVDITLASKNLDEFVDQLKRADAIYMRGGDTPKLKKILSRVKNFKALLKGKVVAGSSAGAYVLAEYCYSNHLKGFLRGFGILPIKVFGHYTNDQKNVLEKLKKHKEDLKTYAIEEGKFVVIRN
jgi:peptidase E